MKITSRPDLILTTEDKWRKYRDFCKNLPLEDLEILKNEVQVFTVVRKKSIQDRKAEEPYLKKLITDFNEVLKKKKFKTTCLSTPEGTGFLNKDLCPNLLEGLKEGAKVERESKINENIDLLLYQQEFNRHLDKLRSEHSRSGLTLIAEAKRITLEDD